ncbi:hypothetical protein AN958_10932 [Leucoagaricus sp. SymC.cos]|nr:hypothetical protein AN958_10932 [Leucoagaricus sp. SymC.cos]
MYLSKVLFFSLVSAIGLVKGQTFTGEETFYRPWLGAYSQRNTEADLIASLNAPQFDANGRTDFGRRIHIFCMNNVPSFRMIVIVTPTGQDKSVDITIDDRCADCVCVSPAAFNMISTPETGRIPIIWQYI